MEATTAAVFGLVETSAGLMSDNESSSPPFNKRVSLAVS
jgi:hypothetical protein